MLALSAYVCCLGACLYVLLPHTLVLEFRGSVVGRLGGELGGAVEAAYSAVTQWLEDFHESNRGALETLNRWLTAGCLALAVEVVLLTLSVTGTL